MAQRAKTAFRKMINIDLPAHQQKEYLRLWTSRNDLENARAFAKHILKKRLHQGHIRSKGAYFQSEAFATALVTSYARAFNEPRNWESKLLSFVNPTKEQLELHELILKARNQLFAHSDLRNYKVTPGRLGHRRMETVESKYFDFDGDQVTRLELFIIRLHEAINLRMANMVDIAWLKSQPAITPGHTGSFP
jgi:hypothetical protein